MSYYILVHGSGYETGTFELAIDETSPATATWVGGDASTGDPDSNTDWFGADNWDVQDVPGTTTSVIIPSGLSYYPVVSRTGVCNSIINTFHFFGTVIH
jgi:hypothetical protein